MSEMTIGKSGVDAMKAAKPCDIKDSRCKTVTNVETPPSKEQCSHVIASGGKMSSIHGVSCKTVLRTRAPNVSLKQAIEQDPVYTQHMKPYGRALECGQKEIGNQVRRPEYSEMVRKVQAGLNEVMGTKVPEDGIFGKETAELVSKFQVGVGMKDIAGIRIGRETISHLLPRLVYSRKEILSMMEECKGIVKEKLNGRFYLSYVNEARSEHEKYVQDVVTLALIRLDMVPYGSDPGTKKGRDAAWTAIQDNFGKPEHFGPEVLRRIEACLEANDSPFWRD